MAQTTLPAGPGVECVLHAYHSPEVTSYDVHHAIPVSMGGPDIASNRVVVCPTGHRNVHVCIQSMIRGKAKRSTWGKMTWDLASRAIVDD